MTPAPLKQAGDAERRLLDDLRATLLHGREVELDAADLDAVHGELVLRAMEQLGGFEQRLRGNAARVQAGAAERVGTVLVLPLVDAGDLELVLAGADRAGIAGGTAADDDDVVLVTCETFCGGGFGYSLRASRRAGSSSASLIATRNCTDSRPSTMR